MRRSFLMGCFVLFLTFNFSPQKSLGQVAKIGPEEPKWGQMLTVTYDPGEAGAKFSFADKVYVIGWLIFPEYTENIWAEMRGFRNLLQHKLPLEEGLSYVKFYFITMNDWDERATVSKMVYRSKGVPARGAHHRSMFSNLDEYKDAFAKEIALYSDNYRAYRDKWFLTSHLEKDSLTSILTRDMEELSRDRKGEPVDLLYSLSFGYLLLEQEEKSREILREMVNRYPPSPLTAYALDDYEYQALTQDVSGEGPEEVTKLKWKILKRYPETEFARMQSPSLCWRENFPLTATEAICRKWMKDEPENPMPYYSLGIAYKTHNRRLDEASSLIERAINLTHEGKLRLYGDISGEMTKGRLPYGYLTLAEISLKQQNYAKALSAAKTAQTLQKETNPKPYLIEAQIWRELSNPSQAQSAYLEAWQKGSKEAEDTLKALYREKHGSLEGFEDYLNKASGAVQEEKQGAPSFQVTSLDGKRLSLEELRGRVVVLNFWFIGCVGCRIEMPSLNRLVKEFQEEDVVFIAFAMDTEKRLRTFLNETKFAYQIIPSSGKIVRQFGVQAYPTHIIVDKKGRIDARLSGGSKTIHENLRPVIERLLKG